MKCSRKIARLDNLSTRYARFSLLLLLVASGISQDTTFRSQSNLVFVPALVRDADGHAVYSLHADDFVVEDNGVPQTVHLDEEAEPQPLSVMVAIQTGRRAWREFGRMQGLNSMLGPVLDQPDSQVAIVTFDSGIDVAQDFTGDASRTEATLEKLQAGDSGAVILDTVSYCVKLLNKVPEGRQRVLLLISETRDHGSHIAKIDDIVGLIGDSNVTVYALVFSPSLSNVLDTERGTNKDEMNPMPDLLAPLIMARQAMKKNIPKAIAQQTGGEYELFETRNRFEARMVDFTNHLHSRYLLSFEPRGPKPGLHQLRVRTSKPGKMTVLARGSYWASAPAQ